MTRRFLRASLALVVCLVTAGGLAAQIAPTLPRDTMNGRKLSPQANVPRGVVAPTLPRDTIGGKPLPATANVIGNTTPAIRSDVVVADTGRPVRRDSSGLRPDSLAVPVNPITRAPVRPLRARVDSAVDSTSRKSDSTSKDRK